MKKFGGWLDEDENVWVGGTSICECCTYCLKCKKNPNKKQKKSVEIEEGDEEFEGEEGEGEGKKRASVSVKRGCCSVFCRAIFCCGSGNTVSREIELADLKAGLKADGAAAEEEGLLANSGDKLLPDDGTNVDPASSDADN